MAPAAALTGRPAWPQARNAPPGGAPESGQDLPPRLLLKDYRPRSIYKVPQSDIRKARFPIIDAHCHGPRPLDGLPEWVKLMDAVGVEKTIIFTGANSAAKFSEIRKAYAKFSGRFDLWCSLDLSGAGGAFEASAVKALKECREAGALGVGEVIDKGWGFRSFRPQGGGAARTPGPHADDPRMDPIWDQCAQLGMPVNLHVSDPIWSYQPMDETNDGFMNAYRWRIDDRQPGILGHDALIGTLERAAQKHRRTLFVASHLANLDYDLTRLGQLFDRNPNLYADVSARFGEIAPVPKFVNRFLRKYPGRVVYGTDMTYSQRMFSNTFRILESEDEHFYDTYQYHWPLYGCGLPDSVLKKVYADNMREVLKRALRGAG